MNNLAFSTICQTLSLAGINFALFEHLPCRTSAESAETRAKAGFPEAVGAKALVTKMNFNDGRVEFNVLVLPGFLRLSSQKIKASFPDLKKFRFVTSEELFGLCEVPPGAMPPFGSPIFPKLDGLFIDERISSVQTVGFNAAFLNKSIVMKSADYLKIAGHQAVLDFAEDEQPSIAV